MNYLSVALLLFSQLPYGNMNRIMHKTESFNYIIYIFTKVIEDYICIYVTLKHQFWFPQLKLLSFYSRYRNHLQNPTPIFLQT